MNIRRFFTFFIHSIVAFFTLTTLSLCISTFFITSIHADDVVCERNIENKEINKFMKDTHEAACYNTNKRNSCIFDDEDKKKITEYEKNLQSLHSKHIEAQNIGELKSTTPYRRIYDHPLKLEKNKIGKNAFKFARFYISQGEGYQQFKNAKNKNIYQGSVLTQFLQKSDSLNQFDKLAKRVAKDAVDFEKEFSCNVNVFNETKNLYQSYPLGF